MIMKGTTEECLKHFSQRTGLDGSDRKEYAVRNAICELMGINPATGYQWFGKFIMPFGLNLLKLRLLLSLNGYEVRERIATQDACLKMADQIALGILKPEDAASLIGINAKSIMRISVGYAGTTSQVIEKINQVVDLHEPDATARLAAWKLEIRKLGLGKFQTKAKDISEQPPPQPLLNGKTVGTEAKECVRVLEHLIQAIKPLAASMLTEEFTKDDRKALRELTTDGRSNAVFEVSNLLNRLCSESALKELQ